MSLFLTWGFHFGASAETLRLAKKCQALFGIRNRFNSTDLELSKNETILPIPELPKPINPQSFKTNPSISSHSTKPVGAFRVTHWNLNNFFTISFAPEVNQQLLSKYGQSSMAAKTQQQLEATRDAIQALNPEVLVLQEVHIGSIKEFIQEYLNHQYEVIEPSKIIPSSSQSTSDIFGTVLLKRVSLNARVVGMEFKNVAHTGLTHDLFEYRFYDPQRASAWNENPLLIIASAHLKSFRENDSSLTSSPIFHESALDRNNREMVAIQKYLDELNQGAFSKIPILFLSDANSNMADPNIRVQLLGEAFSSLKDQVRENELYPGVEGTQVRFKKEVINKEINPRSGSEEVATRWVRLFSELDIIAGNSVAKDNHLSALRLSQQEYYAGFTTSSGVVFPRNQWDRDENYPSDHFPLSSTFKFKIP